MRLDRALSYDYTVAKYFMFATILFGIVGMSVGVFIAFQMAYPDLNYLAGEYGTFSRLRPRDIWIYAFGRFCDVVLHRTEGFKGLYERVAVFDGGRQAALLDIYAGYGRRRV